MIAVAWRLVCDHPSGWQEPLSTWGTFDETESLLADALIEGKRRLKLQSSMEAFAMGGEQRTEWWLDRTNVAALYRWMAERGYLDTTDINAVHRYLQQPELYEPEWTLMTKGKLPHALPAPVEPEPDPFPTALEKH